MLLYYIVKLIWSNPSFIFNKYDLLSCYSHASIYCVLSSPSAHAPTTCTERPHALSAHINHLLSCINTKHGISAAIRTKHLIINIYLYDMTYIKYIYAILYIQTHLLILINLKYN
ncbi:unnamed protein product [Meganyctiphanes norvegica]|uniref:Uncharacterized protein n=1 Tax=Meganyctiphanes norvegica TaxID=48144 RepID=A0AAV2SS36_MEGNR